MDFCKECQRSIYEDDSLAFCEAADGRLSLEAMADGMLGAWERALAAGPGGPLAAPRWQH